MSPYSDPELRRAMQARLRANPDWVVKNRRWQASYRQRTYRIRHGQEYRDRENGRRRKQMDRARELLGSACYLSRYSGDHCKGMFDIHNKNGDEHSKDGSFYLHNIGDFVLLCRRHHKLVHDIGLNRLGIQWPEFLECWERKHIPLFAKVATRPETAI